MNKADYLHVDTSVISNIERGKRELKVCELEIIAKALEVDVLYLLTYPHVYVKKDPNNASEPIETVLQLKLKGEQREKILHLVFGNKDIELFG